MCDTFVALGDATNGAKVILGKNSNREPNEAQALIRIPAQDNSETWVKCTYIHIPQIPHTHEVILSKPFHIWGAEMGVNEHGLTIGNAAVFTKTVFEKDNFGLTGMDMTRLALERANTALQALFLIAQWTEEYGQDAYGGYQDKRFYYCSSFLIADKHDAYVLETADRQWAAKKIKDFYPISNGLTIEGEYDFSSENIIKYAIEKGWHTDGEPFSFRKAYSDRFYTRMSHSTVRRKLSMDLFQENHRKIDAIVAMNILRSHGNQTDKFHPAHGNLKTLCVHASGWTCPIQTTGSMVVELHEDEQDVFWFTGTAAPCISVFKPFFIGDITLLPNQFKQPSATYDESLWWKAERLHRKVLRNYPKLTALFQKELQDLQANFLAREFILRTNHADQATLFAFSKECMERYEQCLKEWTEKVYAAKVRPQPFAPFYRWYRRRLERQLKKFS